MDYSSISAEDLFVQCLRGGNEPEWAEFVRRFQPLLVRVIIRVARHWHEPNTQLVDELLQETYLKLCSDRESILETFHPGHPDSVYGYLKAFVANLAQDHFKAAYARKRGGFVKIESRGHYSEGADLASLASVDRQIERNVLLKEIETVLGGLASGPNSARDRLIFWLYYRSGLAAKSIASMPSIGLTTKGVESTLQRLTAQLRARLCRSEVLNPGEVNKGNMAADSL